MEDYSKYERNHMSQEVKDVAIRALKTFVQAAVAVLVAGYASATDIDGVKALAVGAIAAGVSAAWNAVLTYKS